MTVTALTARLKVLLVSDHKWAVDLVFWSGCFVEVTTTGLGACEDHLVFRSTRDSLQFETLSDRKLFYSHL